MSKFSDQIKTLQQKYENRIAFVVRDTVLGLSQTVVDFSPWGDWPAWSEVAQSSRPSPPYAPGLFKGSWDYHHGAPSEVQTPEVDPTGFVSTQRIEQAVGVKAEWDITVAAEKHFIVNNTSYAALMESGAYLVGHNTQLGHMLALASSSFPAEVREAVQKNEHG